MERLKAKELGDVVVRYFDHVQNYILIERNVEVKVH